MQQPDEALRLAMDTIGRATPAALVAELARTERDGLRSLLQGALTESRARAISPSELPPENHKPFAEAQDTHELCRMLEAQKDLSIDGMPGFTVGQLRTPVQHVIKLATVPSPDAAQIREALIWVPDVQGLRLRLAQLLKITQYLPGTGNVRR